MALIALLCLSTFGNGQVIKNEIVLGNIISLESIVLNEERDFYVYLPAGYEQSDEKYPVMYVLDGETKFTISAAIANFLANNRQIPQMIVIGIPNVARNRDFTPAIDERMQNSGGADNFISFLDKELIEFVDNTYRTQNFKVLFGHSLCGMFSAYTLFTNPDLFNAYIAASPYLMMSNEYVIKKAEEVLIAQTDFNNQLYMSIGNEPTYFKSLDKFKSLLNKNDSELNWILHKYDDEDHASIPFRTISDGLGFIFSDWRLTIVTAMKGVDAIKKHIDNSNNKYGFTKQMEPTLNFAGYQLLQAGEIEKAIEIFEYNIELYPSSANVYDSLGDGYDAQGSKKKALTSYTKAVSLAETNNNPSLAIFKQNLERLKN